MRTIGSLRDETLAQTFRDYLLVQDIPSDLEKDNEGDWAIWIHSDDQLEEAVEHLRQYIENPNNPQYAEAAEPARGIRSEKHRGEKRYRGKIVDVRTSWAKQNMAYTLGPLTVALMAICISVALFTGLGAKFDLVRKLLISEYYRQGLLEVRQGQIWRLLTPIFLHFGPIHILFNMMWLKSLGAMLENRLGPWRLLARVVAIGVLSNLGQYLVSGPQFGGMSGVVYGLAGYIWIRGRHDPGSGLFLDKNTVVMLVIWFFLCLSGMIGNIANTAHGLGFALGISWAYIDSGELKRRLLK